MEEPSFRRIGNIETRVPKDLVDRCYANVTINLCREISEIEDLPLGKMRGKAAVVGAGPSLDGEIETLCRFSSIFATGSVHDHLIDLGLIPNYYVTGESDSCVSDYIRNPQYACTYLIASQCSPTLFEKLDAFNVVRWHAGGAVDVGWLEWQLSILGGYYVCEIANKPIFTGGNCIGLRAISLVRAFGFDDIHLFGFDGCLTNGKRYSFARPEEDWQEMPIIQVKIGDQEFWVPADMLAPLNDFGLLFATKTRGYRITVHGDGAVAALAKGSVECESSA